MIKIYKDEDILKVIDEIAELYKDVFGVKDEERDFFRLRILNSVNLKKNPIALVKFNNHKIIGVIYGFDFLKDNWWAKKVDKYLPDFKDWYVNSFELNELFVDKENQGQGVGNDLIRALSEIYSMKNILLSTRKYNNDKAIKFYMNCGFKILSDSVVFDGNIEYLILYKEK